MEKQMKTVISDILSLLHELNEIHTEADDPFKKIPISTSQEKLRHWKRHALKVLTGKIIQEEFERIDGVFNPKAFVVYHDPRRNFEAYIIQYRTSLSVLLDQLQKYPGEYLVTEQKSEKVIDQKKKTIFIIHGHDTLNASRLYDLISTEWKLNPIMLVEKSNVGRVLLEKFEEEAKRADYVFALLTPDDVVNEETEYSQARPNVVFELGWFYGRIGRGRVCIALKDGTTLHSDIEGITRYNFKESVDEIKGKLRQELETLKFL